MNAIATPPVEMTLQQHREKFLAELNKVLPPRLRNRPTTTGHASTYFDRAFAKPKYRHSRYEEEDYQYLRGMVDGLWSAGVIDCEESVRLSHILLAASIQWRKENPLPL